ncbi:MAG TPA: S28 family serine protease [Bacteroidales bacterium]|nr:S28 family serine protease [Bacteroidales bacterium]
MKTNLFLLILISLVAASCQTPMTLEERLATLDAERIDSIRADSMFSHAYEIHLMQPVDHNNPEGPKFSQRLFLSYAGADLPVVMVTAGYSSGRNSLHELTRYLNCNQIIVEHRYFGESVPEEVDWQYMNTFQAASDHHRIIELFSELFTNKWITTGSSKGGQTVMYHSYYYPDDADIRVPYVAPLNFGPEDPRIYTFLDTVGSDECREKIYKVQRLILENRDTYFPAMLEMANNRGMTFERVGGAEIAFELTVLEYDFAFWQNSGLDCDAIILEGSPEEIAGQFFRVANFFYFSDQGIASFEPFFYQALTEIGYYGYRFDRFEGLLRYAMDSELPEYTFSAPEGVDLVYNYDLMQKVNDYLQEADNFIFIYGGQDTWSATGVQLSGKSNSIKILKKGGNHGTRIGNLPEETGDMVLSTINHWLQE